MARRMNDVVAMGEGEGEDEGDGEGKGKGSKMGAQGTTYPTPHQRRSFVSAFERMKCDRS
jgi:hypothetical protein